MSDTLWKLAAVRHVFALMKDDLAIFSCSPPEGCMESLQRMLLEDASLDDVPKLDWIHGGNVFVGAEQSYVDWADWKKGESLFLSVSLHDPRRAKKLQQGSLLSSDVGVNVHAVWHVKPPEVAVSSTPLNLDLAGTDYIGKDLVAVVLSLAMFSLESLYYFRMWTRKCMTHRFNLSGLDNSPPSETTVEDHEDVANQAGELGVLPLPTSVGAARFIEWLVAEGLSKSDKGKLVLTDAGRDRICSGWVLGDAKRCLQARDVPKTDMSKFELMPLLQDDGWRFQHYASRKDLGDLAADYVAGSRKIWVFKVKDNAVQLKAVMDAYLRCLATAGEHGRLVPHFAKAGEYEFIMDPTFQPKKKRRKKVV